MKKIIMLLTAMLVVGVASAQKKTFETMVDKAVTENIMTEDQKAQMLEINKEFVTEKAKINKSSLSEEEKKAENKKIEGKKVEKFKKVLGDKWGDWAKFRDEYWK